MKTANLERLLCLLDVRLHALALCELSTGWRLSLPATEKVLVHYILEGAGVLRTLDGTAVAFRPNMLLFIPPNSDHEIAGQGDNPNLAVWREIASPISDGLMRFTAGSGVPAIVSACGTISADCGGLDLFAHMREPVAEDASGNRTLNAAFAILLQELREPRFGTRALCEALMKQCLVLALRGHFERGELGLLPVLGLHDPRLLRALVEMMENPAVDHSLDELAKVSGMSRSLFAERFTEAFERPPMDLLRQIRLHRAANLLRRTGLPVQIVALAVGYASRSYFSRAFRAAYGADPKSFREQARGIDSSREEEN